MTDEKFLKTVAVAAQMGIEPDVAAIRRLLEMASSAQRVRDLVSEWVGKRGHDRCWYYPEIFGKVAEALGVELPRDLGLPPRAEFEEGCRRYQMEQYAGEKPARPRYLLVAPKNLMIGATYWYKEAGREPVAVCVWQKPKGALASTLKLENQPGNDFPICFTAHGKVRQVTDALGEFFGPIEVP